MKNLIMRSEVQTERQLKTVFLVGKLPILGGNKRYNALIPLSWKRISRFRIVNALKRTGSAILGSQEMVIKAVRYKLREVFHSIHLKSVMIFIRLAKDIERLLETLVQMGLITLLLL